jgi:hypothetical protein
MTDDDEIHPRLSNGGQSHFDMDEAFCARIEIKIARLNCNCAGHACVTSIPETRSAGVDNRTTGLTRGDMQ